MPTIYINLGYFLDIGNMPLASMMLRLFLDGGWIPLLYVLGWGAFKLFVMSRQKKFGATLSFVVLAIDVPRANEQTPKAVENIFTSLSGAFAGFDTYEKYWLGKGQATFSFELVSIGGYVQFLVHCQAKFRDLIEAAVFSQYPDAEIVEVEDYATKVPDVYPDPEYDAFGTEFVLKAPSHLPLKTYIQFEHSLSEEYFKDPLSHMLEVFGALKSGEQLWLQILVTPTDDTWKEKSKLAVDKMLGKEPAVKKGVAVQLLEAGATELKWALGAPAEVPKKADTSPKIASLTPGERLVLENIQLKAAKIGFNCKMRMVYVGRRDVFSKGRVRSSLMGALSQFNTLNMNAIKGYGLVTPKSDYFWQRWSTHAKTMAIVKNYRGRSGRGAPAFILNTEELATLWHFPSMLLKAPLVKKTESKRAEPPVTLPTLEANPFGPFKKVKPPALTPAVPTVKDQLDDEEEFLRNLPG